MKKLSLLLFIFPLFAKANPERAPLQTQAQPLCLLENKGQVKDQHGRYRADIDYVIHDDGMNLFVSATGISYQWSHELADAIKFCRVDAELLGANTGVKPIAENELAYYEHYYHPAFGVDGAIAHSYGRIIYRDVYPSIDRVLYIKNGKAEYDFVIRKGGKIDDIVINYKGVTEIKLEVDGTLKLLTILGEVKESAPVCFSSDGKKIKTVYSLDNGKLKFKAERHGGELRIDPTLQWSTYYGGSSQEMGASYLSYDPAGFVYLAASTKSTNNIATVGSYQETRNQVGNNNATNAFIVKFDTNGVRQWATYYSGELNSTANNIAIDAAGDIYICGGTDCLTGMATTGTYQTTKGPGSSSDVFIAKFSGTGARIWGTYFGGGGQEQAFGLELDDQGHFYISGYTQSEDSIATSGAHQTVYGNPGVLNAYDGFLAKFDTTGNIIWSTYYGGEKMDRCADVCVDNSGYVYLCGYTHSLTNIATVGSHQNTHMSAGVKQNAFLVKFNQLGVRQWATYYGDTGSANGNSLACTSNEVYMSGGVQNGMDVATPGTFQPNYSGAQKNGYISKFSNAGVRLWGTYFGTEGYSGVGALSLDGNGYLFFGGSVEGDSLGSACSHLDSCIDCDPIGISSAEGSNIFGIFNASGERIYSSYFGRAWSGISSTCLTPTAIYLGGSTNSSTVISTSGVHQVNYGGGVQDCFIAKFSLCSVPTQPVISGDTIICENMDAVYEVDLSASCYGASYIWSLPTGWSGSSTGSSIQVTANTMSGTITVTPYNVCGMAGPPGSLYVTVLPVVTTPVITLSGNVLSTGSYDNYQWYLNGNLITGATNQSYTATQQGTYTVQVWDTGTCDVTSTGITLDVQNIGNAINVALYPNPTRGGFTLEAGETGTAIITDIQGRLIARYQVAKGKNSITLPAGAASSVYLLQFRTEKGTVNLRLVKE